MKTFCLFESSCEALSVEVDYVIDKCAPYRYSMVCGLVSFYVYEWFEIDL